MIVPYQVAVRVLQRQRPGSAGPADIREIATVHRIASVGSGIVVAVAIEQNRAVVVLDSDVVEDEIGRLSEVVVEYEPRLGGVKPPIEDTRLVFRRMP